MFYLPPLPDDAVINGPGHVEDSEKLDAFLVALAELYKIVIDPVTPPEPGTNGHVAWHNAIVKNTKTVADSLGVPVTLPPLVVKAGELAHVTHHNLIRQALLDASTKAWNDATGGAVSTYTVDGKKMRCHIFTSPGTFTVSRMYRPFRVLVVGGGGGGGGGQSQGGAGGQQTANDNAALPIGSYPVAVGGAGGNSNLGAITAVGGAYMGNVGRNGQPGTKSDITGTLNGYGGGGGVGGYTAGDPSYTKLPGTGVDGGGNGGYSNAGRSGQNGYPNTGGGGGGGGQDDGGSADGYSGGSGIVIVSYQIGIA